MSPSRERMAQAEYWKEHTSKLDGATVNAMMLDSQVCAFRQASTDQNQYEETTYCTSGVQIVQTATSVVLSALQAASLDLQERPEVRLVHSAPS